MSSKRELVLKAFKRRSSLTCVPVGFRHLLQQKKNGWKGFAKSVIEKNLNGHKTSLPHKVKPDFLCSTHERCITLSIQIQLFTKVLKNISDF